MATFKKCRRKCCAEYAVEYKAMYSSILLSLRAAGRGWTRAYIKYEYGLDMTDPPVCDKELAFWRACTAEIREDAKHFAKLGEAEKRCKCATEDSKIPPGRIFVLADSGEHKTAKEMYEDYSHIPFMAFYRIMIKLDAKGNIGRDTIEAAVAKRERLDKRRKDGAIKPRKTRIPAQYNDIYTGKTYTANAIKRIHNTVAKSTIDKILGKCNKEGSFSLKRVAELLSSMVLRGPRRTRVSLTTKSH